MELKPEPKSTGKIMRRTIRSSGNRRLNNTVNNRSHSDADSPIVRLFVAINLPNDVKAAATKEQDNMRSALAGINSQTRAIRWVQPNLMHLTLLFLGEVSLSQLENVKSALRLACDSTGTFGLCLSGLGCFPNMRRPRVVWRGIEGDTVSLQQLQGQISTQLQSFVAKLDEKKFHPHLTLARIKAEDKILSHQIGKVIQGMDKPMDNIEWTVDSVEIMRSVLKPSGPEYSIEESIRLDKNKL